MYLMDHIVETSHLTKKKKNENHPVTSIFPLLEQKLEGCPRFLFDEDTIHTAVELTLGRPKVLREAMHYLQIPYKKFWVEWPEAGRQKLRDTFVSQEELINPLRPLPIRLGFLLETDWDNRSGRITWVWNNHLIGEYEPPNVCPISAFFDLDGNYSQDSVKTNFLQANIAQMWKNNPLQTEALLSIWRTSQHKPSEWGYQYIRYTGYGSYAVQNFYADVYGEYIMVWAIMMLLTSSKKIIELESVDMSRLNKARIKNDKAPKLDHTVVTMHINSPTIRQQGVPLGHARKSPRIHQVSHYLGRRGNKHWIVEPYWRGSGEIISRHVKVRP
jgi:hypothetical protein